jgi:uncharacterized protein YodC (DUF2158 family)
MELQKYSFKEFDEVVDKSNGRIMTVEEVSKFVDIDTGEEEPTGTIKCSWVEHDKENKSSANFNPQDLEFYRREID